MVERIENEQSKMSDYDRGWDDYMGGAEGPNNGTENAAWWMGFNEAAGEYPRDDDA